MMAGKKTVLIAEDSNLTQKVIRFMLDTHGYDIVAQCINGKDAVAKYGELKPDIVLMDLAMPQMDGIAAIKKIMKINPKANILVISALYNPTMKEDALKAGAKEYIVKPFEISELIESIESMVK